MARIIKASCVALAASITVLAGCATNEQGVVVFDPAKANALITAAITPTPPAPPVIVEAPVIAYAPVPTDLYVANVVDTTDVIFVSGNTYVWVVGPDGHRVRHFYAHGDHRDEVFHRRDDLHRVMEQHGGHLPDHRIEAAGPGHSPERAVAREEFARNARAAQNHAPGAAPAHPAAPPKPAMAAKPAPTKENKKT